MSSIAELSVFTFGAFLGVLVYVSLFIAVALFGPHLGQNPMRGAIGMVLLLVLAAAVGGMFSMIFTPFLVVIP